MKLLLYLRRIRLCLRVGVGGPHHLPLLPLLPSPFLDTFSTFKKMRRDIKALIGAVLLGLKCNIIFDNPSEQKTGPSPIGIGQFNQELPLGTALHSHFASLTARSSKRHGPLVLCLTGGKA